MNWATAESEPPSVFTNEERAGLVSSNENLSQLVTSNKRGGRKKLPRMQCLICTKDLKWIKLHLLPNTVLVQSEF